MVSLRKHCAAFLSDTSGAVTVDWTVLAASVVGLGLASVGAVRMGTSDLGADVQATLSGASVYGLSRVSDPTRPDPGQGAANIWTMGWGFDTGRNYDLGGWTRTNGDGGMVQLIRSGYAGVNSLTGGHMIDMYYNGLAALQNTVTVGTGESVFLSFNAVDPRNGANGNAMDIYFGGQIVGTVQPGAGTMRPYSFELVGGSGNGSNVVELRPRQTTSDVYGLWVEQIVVQ